MTGNNLNVEKPAPVASATPSPAVNVISNTGDTIDSQTLLKMVNEARKLCGEPEVRNNKFIKKILDELEGEDGYTKSATVPPGGGTPMVVITMTYKQALRVAARESKAVRRSLIDKLEELQQANSPAPSIPQTLPDALRLAAELAEQKMQLEQQLVAAAPKVDFADRVSAANGILIGNFAKVVGLKQNALFSWLRQNGILMAFGARKNVPRQQYINAGYFTVKEVVLDDENGYQIRLTPQLTGKGQQWLTRKLLDAGLLKPVAIG
ncbi:phage antirepressor Ant [Escherichia coli]|nr:phage antirepressor Ant [Escherichia coli]MBC1167255.1 phage antirepressor KilAC domain-containing protein [Escherichia coli]HAY4248449.1 phage antirepressor Ant [Escherichia coli]HBA5345185.1 phage antirepressor Ant [Escherichia coli]HBB0264019.1 phage antirepressor Ant [Escherichia coli]